MHIFGWLFKWNRCSLY